MPRTCSRRRATTSPCGATICADIDRDGDIVLFTTEIRHWWAGSGADGSELLVSVHGQSVEEDAPGARQHAARAVALRPDLFAAHVLLARRGGAQRAAQRLDLLAQRIDARGARAHLREVAFERVDEPLDVVEVDRLAAALVRVRHGAARGQR